MQHRPGRLVTTQSQNPLQPKRTYAVLLIRYVPHRGKPATQRCSALFEYRPRPHAALIPTTPADQALTAGSERFASLATFRTNKSATPTQPFKKLKALLLVGKPIEKLAPCARVILSCNRITWGIAHHYILTEVELTGYPVYYYSISRIQGKARCRILLTPQRAISRHPAR